MSIQMDKKVVIKNLCNWTLTFARLNTIGDVVIPPNGRLSMTADEILAQCYNNNKLFVGEDGLGSHARILIDDKDLRVELQFETEDGKSTQAVLTEDKVKELFELKTLSTFKKRVEENVVTHGEKNFLVECAKKLKINDYEKLKFVEAYTGFKLD